LGQNSSKSAANFVSRMRGRSIGYGNKTVVGS